ncbi:MAG: proton-conducting transporter membrane subunit, partial [Verrucomicrobiota bacterium]
MQDTVVQSWLPVWACLASLLAIPAIVIFRRELFLREASTFVAGFVKLGFVIAIYQIVKDGKIVECQLFDGIAGINAPIVFRVDSLGILFALVASSLWIVTSLYGIGYMRGLKEHAQTRFFSFFALSLSATLGVAFAGNLLTLYLFYELLSLSTWPLVTHHQDKEARGGGRTYLTYLLTTSIGFALPALIFTYFKSGGNLSFMGDAILANQDMGYWPTLFLLLGFAFGFSKAGMMPFHSWLPGAMVAPTPVSALLHAVAVVKVGVFCVIRAVTEVLGVDLLLKLNANLVLCWIAAFTVIVSSLIALSQDNLKRRLAFSTIGQLSYIVLGIALLSETAMTGSVLHIAAHAVGKITLFFCAGAIYVATGKKYISQMAGLGKQMPFTFGAFFIGSLGVIGLPPTIGLISKFHLVLGAAEAGQIALMIVFFIST